VAKLNEKDFAKDYGWALSFLKSDAELYKLFKKAVAGTWTADKFVAAVKTTKWFKKHGDAYRQNLALKTSNPGEYASKLNGVLADLHDKAGAMGATLSGAQYRTIASHYLDFGWNDSQLNDVLANYVRYSNARGQANTNIQAMQQSAWRNGVKVNSKGYEWWAQAIAEGSHTVDDFSKLMRKSAQSMAPGFADQLKAGMDLFDVASPYMQSMSTLLEKNPADIDLFTPQIRSALSHRGADGKLQSMTISEFEQGIRNTHDWMKTDQAQDQTMAVAHQVLNDWGLAN
jgi:hypothetical protein